MRNTRPHDDAIAELLRDDPAFADEYLSAALDEADLPGGHEALLASLRHIAKHCHVTSQFVGKVRKGLIPVLAKPNETVSFTNTNTLKEKGTSSKPEIHVLAMPNETASFTENPAEYDPAEHELQEAHDTITHLAEEKPDTFRCLTGVLN